MSGTLTISLLLGVSLGAEGQQAPAAPAAPLYHEALRPQFHVTARYWDNYTLNPGPHEEGWINDVNGLVYYDGEYHFFAQRWWSCWLHAVSRDLVHWEELPPAFGKEGEFGGTQSGGAVVDYENTSGLGDGGTPPMVAFWSGTDNLNQCISYSLDRGRSWAKYEGNPVLAHPERDPAVFWYAPKSKWIMILYGTEPIAALGAYGFNGEGNDAHDLIDYRPGEWKCSVLRVHADGTVIVSDQVNEGQRKIDMARQNIGAKAFYVGSKTGKSEFLRGDVAEILVFDRPLTEEETDRLTGRLASKWGLAGTSASPEGSAPEAGLVLHLEPSQVTVDETGRVLRWKDRSGRGHDQVQTEAGKRPGLVDGAVGELPAVHFSGEQFLRGPAVLPEGSDAFTIVAVWRRDALGVSEVICEQNTAELAPGGRAALLTEGQRKKAGYLLFESRDLLTWSKLGTMIEGMFECPDMFPLPVDGNVDDTRWVIIDGDGGYVVGRFDGEVFTAESDRLTSDWGRSFYATRSFNGLPEEDGRRIQMAWMRGGEYPGMPFNQQITFPCSLTLHRFPEGIRMCRNPIKEIAQLHGKQWSFSDLAVKPGDNPLAEVAGELFDIEVEIDVTRSDCEAVALELHGRSVRYDVGQATVHSCGSSAPLAPADGLVRLRVLVDRMSVETFGNKGRVVLTNVAGAEKESAALSVTAIGGTAHLRSLVVREVCSIWP